MTIMAGRGHVVTVRRLCSVIGASRALGHVVAVALVAVHGA
jgi:hypothetical protein